LNDNYIRFLDVDYQLISWLAVQP